MIWRIKHVEDNCNIVYGIINVTMTNSMIIRVTSWNSEVAGLKGTFRGNGEWLAHVNPARMMREIWCVQSRLFPITHWSCALTKYTHGWVRIYPLMRERFVIYLILSEKFVILICFIIEKDYNCKIYTFNALIFAYVLFRREKIFCRSADASVTCYRGYDDYILCPLLSD